MKYVWALLLVVVAVQCGIFDLIPGRCPKCKSLPEVFHSMNDTEVHILVKDIQDVLYHKMGFKIPSFIIELAIKDIDMLLDYLQFTPKQLRQLANLMNELYRLHILPKMNTTVPIVPDGFDFKDLKQFPIDLASYLPAEEPIPLLPNLYKQFTRTDASEDRIYKEIVMSFMFNQLSKNSQYEANHPNQTQFIYNQQPVDNVAQFLRMLVANGHTIKSYLTWRAVDFFGYKTKVDGEFYEVPFPVFININRVDPETGKTLVTPTIHDEFVIEISSSDKTTGTKIDATLLWYEGDTGIGFFAGDIYGLGDWVGTVNGQYMEGEESIEAIHYMSLLGNALLRAAEDLDLYDYGYGITGVCVDSTGVIEDMLLGKVSLYPMLIDKRYVLPTLSKLQKAVPRYAQDYQKIFTSVDRIVPDFVYRNPTASERILTSLPWKAGEEPFASAVQIRKVLSTL